MNNQIEPSPRDGLLSQMAEADRERLGEALRRLLGNGSILGQEYGDLRCATGPVRDPGHTQTSRSRAGAVKPR